MDYDELTPENMVVTDLDGKILEGDLRPSSDLPTHVQLYKTWSEIGSVVHTHSTEAVGWAQAGRDIPFYGTTHADYFYGSIPCARSLTKDEVEVAYEKDTGLVIVEEFEHRGLNPVEVPGIVVRNHGPFTWGKKSRECCLSLCRTRGSIKDESLYRTNQSKSWTCSPVHTRKTLPT